MNYRLNKVAAAVAVGLGVSVVGVNTANADQLLFPYVATFPTVTTLVSVVNEGNPVNSDTLHYHYYYKSTKAGTVDSLAAPCGEVDFVQNSSANDVVTFDVSGVYGDKKLGVLYEQNIKNTADEYSEDPANSFIALPEAITGGSSRAFLLVDNDDVFNFVGENLHGEVFIMEFENGATWGYQAYNAAGIGRAPDGVQLNRYEFSDRVETTGEVLVNTNTLSRAALTSIMPFDQISTRFFVTPIATTANEVATQLGLYPGGPFQFRPNLAAAIGLSINDPALSGQGVMYDRDENPVSGRVAVPVTCVGGVNVTQMLDPAVPSRVAEGGWAYIRVLSRNPAFAVDAGGFPTALAAGSAPVNSTAEAVVFKLEFNDKAKPELDGKRVGGIFNNGFWVKKGIRESQTRPFGIYDIPATIGNVAVFDEPNSPYPLINTAGTPWQLANGLPLDNVPVTSVVQ